MEEFSKFDIKRVLLAPEVWETLIKSFLNPNGGLPGWGLGEVSWGHWGLRVSFRPHQKSHLLAPSMMGGWPGALRGVLLGPGRGIPSQLPLVRKPQNELRAPHQLITPERLLSQVTSFKYFSPGILRFPKSLLSGPRDERRINGERQ